MTAPVAFLSRSIYFKSSHPRRPLILVYQTFIVAVVLIFLKMKWLLTMLLLAASFNFFTVSSAQKQQWVYGLYLIDVHYSEAEKTFMGDSTHSWSTFSPHSTIEVSGPNELLIELGCEEDNYPSPYVIYDCLGRDGWELVAVRDFSSGLQHHIFKKRLDS